MSEATEEFVCVDMCEPFMFSYLHELPMGFTWLLALIKLKNFVILVSKYDKS